MNISVGGGVGEGVAQESEATMSIHTCIGMLMPI